MSINHFGEIGIQIKRFIVILVVSLFCIAGCSMPEEDCSLPRENYDSTAPTPGNSGAMTISSIRDTSFTANWTEAMDNTSGEEDLLYQIYYSPSDNISTIEDIEQNGTKAGTYTADINSKSVIGLTASSTYYVNLIVKDMLDNKSAYTSVELSTYQAIPSAYIVKAAESNYDGVYLFNGMKNNKPSYIRQYHEFTGSLSYFSEFSHGVVKWRWNIEAENPDHSISGRYWTSSSFLPPPPDSSFAFDPIY